ncbi:MAG: 4Fe-4S dicluster domain-containing protein [Chloroflexota bacterium]
MHTVFVDPLRCIGCLQCEFACAVEHSHTRDPVAALGDVPVPRKRVHVQAGPRANTAFPNKCRHCDPAPCLQVCPTGAIFRDAAHDSVLIDTGRCIACAMCAMVCPFDVITYHPVADRTAPYVAATTRPGTATYVAGDGHATRAVAVKCDACIARQLEGRIPACVEVCKVGALRFGEINEFVAAGQRRETAAVLAASSAEPPPMEPDPLGAWRELGATVGHAGGAR